MAQRGLKALVLWKKENKTGIENATNVPENSRFAGAVTPVMFSGDRKWYPAKVIMVHDDVNVLERNASEVDEEIEKQSSQVPSKRKRTINKRLTSPSVASESEIAVAVGTKKPIPKPIEDEKKESFRAKKIKSQIKNICQNQLDASIISTQSLTSAGRKSQSSSPAMAASKRALFQDQTDASSSHIGDMPADDRASHDDSGDDMESDLDSVSHGVSEDEANIEPGDVSSNLCSCGVCLTLKKHNGPSSRNFLKDLLAIFSISSSDGGGGGGGGVQYLNLLTINENVRKVELTRGRGVFISLSDKTRLKVDFHNKPSSLIRETLFSLYGKDVFRCAMITARGTKPGSCGMRENVLNAVLGFVNRNVDEGKQMKLSHLVNLINKRTADWRNKVSSSPAEPKKCTTDKRKKKSNEMKVTATSPWKAQSLDSESDEKRDDARKLVDANSPKDAQMSSAEKTIVPVVHDADQPQHVSQVPLTSPAPLPVTNMPPYHPPPPQPSFRSSHQTWPVRNNFQSMSQFYHHEGQSSGQEEQSSQMGGGYWNPPQEQHYQPTWNYIPPPAYQFPSHQGMKSPMKSANTEAGHDRLHEPALTPL